MARLVLSLETAYRVMDIINLTPHTLNIFDEQGRETLEIEPSGQTARVETTREKVDEVAGVPIYETTTDEVVGLPEPKEDTLYVVSGFVCSEVDRSDVVSPGELIRNDDGNPIGAKGFSR